MTELQRLVQTDRPCRCGGLVVRSNHHVLLPLPDRRHVYFVLQRCQVRGRIYRARSGAMARAWAAQQRSRVPAHPLVLCEECKRGWSRIEGGGVPRSEQPLDSSVVERDQTMYNT